MHRMVLFIGLYAFLLGQTGAAHARLEVFTCEPEWKALVEELGGDLVDVFSATTAHQDPHHIEARPSLIAKARTADMLVCTGAELEVGWLPVLQRQSGNARIQSSSPSAFFAADQVQRLEVPDEVDRSSGHVHAGGNPHVHLDPRLVMKIAEALAARLGSIDAEHRDRYQQQLASFRSSWDNAIAEWERRAVALRGARAVVHHRIWSYLFDWLGIDIVAELEPKPGLPPTSPHLAELLHKVKEEKPEFIVYANYQDPKAAIWLGERSGIPYLELPYTVGASAATQDLFTLMDALVAKLARSIQ